MNKRRSVCALMGKLGLISFYSPSIYSSINPSSINFNQKEKKIFVDFFNSSSFTSHYKVRPGEKVRIFLRNKTSFRVLNESILFQMPMISLRPHILFRESKKNFKLPLVIISPKGKPVKDKRRWCSAECRDEHTLYANKL